MPETKFQLMLKHKTLGWMVLSEWPSEENPKRIIKALEDRYKDLRKKLKVVPVGQGPFLN